MQLFGAIMAKKYNVAVRVWDCFCRGSIDREDDYTYVKHDDAKDEEAKFDLKDEDFYPYKVKVNNDETNSNVSNCMRQKYLQADEFDDEGMFVFSFGDEASDDESAEQPHHRWKHGHGDGVFNGISLDLQDIVNTDGSNHSSEINWASTDDANDPNVSVEFSAMEWKGEKDILSAIHLENILSIGTFGTIRKATFQSTDCVIKMIKYQKESQEVILHNKAQSQFVARLYASLLVNNRRWICLRYYNHGDLLSWLKRDPIREFFCEQPARWLTACLLLAVQYLHRQGVLHLDIKPANILIGDDGYPVLTDFGCSRSFDGSPLFGHGPFTTMYASPELLEGLEVDPQADLWAVACVAYDIIYTRPAFVAYSRNEVELKIHSSILPEMPRLFFSDAAIDYLSHSFGREKHDRLGFMDWSSDAMEHWWFKSIRFNNHRQQLDISPILSVMKSLSIVQSED